MQQPIQITFRGMDPSDAVEARIRELSARLERFSDQVTSCHVIVETPHRRHQQGNIYEVRIELHVPGREIAIHRGDAPNHAHEDVYVALRDAFDAAGRQLEDYVRTRDHRVRVHERSPVGEVMRLFPQDGYGFIETADGLEVYFHEHSVVGGEFQKLAVGDVVQIELAEGESELGPQATTVKRAGRSSRPRRPAD